MAKLPFPIFLKDPVEDQNVFALGKHPDLYARDLREGCARIGGSARHPSYFFSYEIAARKLIEDGKVIGTFDDTGLPVFYLQRHATELLLKRLLSWCHDIVGLRSTSSQFQFRFSKGEIDRLSRSHDLKQLYKDLLKAATTLGYKAPNEVGHLVNLISNHELTETFARYDRSKSKNADEVSHVAKESILPIVEIQRLLETAAKVTLHQDANSENFEADLYDEWNALNHAEES